MFDTLKLDRDKELSKQREQTLKKEWNSGRTRNRNNHRNDDMPDLNTAQEERIISFSDFDYE